MATIAPALERIKQDLRPFLPNRLILQCCRAAGHRWRRRCFDPLATIHLFVLQILNFNTAICHLRHLAKRPVNAAAYCKARMRLPLAALQMLLRRTSAALAQPSGRRWCGLRVLLVDGSSSITPDTPQLLKHFGHPTGQKPGCGLPVAKLLGLMDAFSGLIVEVLCFPLFTHEMSKVWKLHPLLSARDLLVGDRGFCSFAHLAMLFSRGTAGLFRMHQRQIVSFRPHRQSRGKGQRGKPGSRFVKRLGQWDQIVHWLKPKEPPGWMSCRQYAALPATLRVRELRFVLARKGQRTRVVTIATTLLDPKRFPKEKIAALYGVRWQVETHFAELKTTLKMRKLKSKTVAGVQKELAIYCLVYNLIHAVMLKAAAVQKVTPDRISFIDTLRWLLSAQPGEELPQLVVNPLRPDRHEPRVLKDRPATYSKMTLSRQQWKKRRKIRTKIA
jgi:hypothetical protein